MKHPVTVTSMLIVLFLAAQIIGLSLLSLNITAVTEIDGSRVVEHATTALGDRPAIGGAMSLLYLVIGVAIGTSLVLLMIKYRFFGVWKAWFLLAIWISLTVALGVVLPTILAAMIGLLCALWKVYRPNPIIHNLVEVFMYAGLAVMLVPLFSIGWAILMLLIISIYDVVAVWQSKHMVVMAEAQTKSNLFAGLYIPKRSSDQLREPSHPQASAVLADKNYETKGSRSSSAILGGGDIAFPLLFSGVVMDWLIISGSDTIVALYATMIVSVSATLALALLFAFAKKDRYYPAMPFLSAGCLLGLGIIYFVV